MALDSNLPRRTSFFRTLSAIGLALLLQSAHAGSNPASLEEAFDLLDRRDQWQTWNEPSFPRHPAEKFLEGWVIVLDPGHGGDAHRRGYKRGPTGVREAEMNWRVGIFLERLLSDAGALVTLTRSGDHDISLTDRANIANNIKRPDGGTGADLFISLHHNATSSRKTNYASVWHHGEIDWSEPDIDVARYIAHSLFRHLRTDAALTSYLLSDQLMYSTGFGVLRQTNVPAILLESSFYTNPEEEQRLADPVYNLREAYAIYEALCEYAYGGRPTQSIPEITQNGNSIILKTNIDDGLPKNWWGSNRSRTVASSIRLFLNDEPVETTYDPATKSISAELPISARDLSSSGTGYNLRIHHANFAKHHNWPQRYHLNLSRTFDNQLAADFKVLGARRAGAKPAILAQGEPDSPKPETEPAPEPALFNEKSVPAIHTGEPGDLIPFNHSVAQNITPFPLRISAIPGPQFIFSDGPEHLRSENGIALQEKVAPGLVRLYVYHAAESKEPKNITALIENTGSDPMTIRFHRYAFPKPGRNYHAIGKEGLTAFLSATNLPDNLTVAPGEILPIDPNMNDSIVSNGDLVHGFYEFEIDQPARISTLQRDPEMSAETAVKSLDPFPKVLENGKPTGAGRGLFPVSNFLVTTPSNHPVDTADGPLKIILADGKTDLWMIGTDTLSGEPAENRGNYGALYRIRLKRTSSDGRSHAILMQNRFGDNSPCDYLASAVEIRRPGKEPEIVPVPLRGTGFKGGPHAALLQVLPPLPEGETEIVEILFSPPGASCLPNPVFLVPF